MKPRTKVLSIIITTWLFLITLILFASESIFISGFAKLERDLAEENANRAAHVSIAMLNHIYQQNLDNSYWDKTYDYMSEKNPDFIEENFYKEFFTDNDINYVLIFGTTGKLIWSSGYDLTSKENIPIIPELSAFFQKNGLALLTKKDEYYAVDPKQYGATGFLQLPDNTIGYFSINYIEDSNDTKPPLGYMVFGKIIDEEYIKKLSKDIAYPVKLISLREIQKNSARQRILRKLINSGTSYTVPLSNKTFLSYILIKDFTGQPIAILRIEQSRTIYNASKESALNTVLTLLGLSFLGMVAMTVLVFLFFRKQDLITQSFERFVPHQLIELLRKRDILEIGLGDHSKKNISVLFMDIRNFTSISEGLSPQENFDFINKLLERIAPVILDHHGFIDKYIGDAVMALFPHERNNADDAVKAAKVILAELDKLNHEGLLKDPVEIGIGINTGEAMLGIIGAEGRLEGTVISDMVNTASRIQNLTKTYGHSILISEACYKTMKHPELYTIELVDEVSLKGKKVKIFIYAVK